MLAALMLMCSCASNDPPYEDLAEDGYNICVRYDANGGDFANNGSFLTVIDVYHSSSESIKLYDPNDSTIRKPQACYNAEKSMSSYKLAGWYPVETNEKGEILNTEGGVYVQGTGQTPMYRDTPWNFEEETFTIESGKIYSRDLPAITLCAKWVSHYTYEFYIEDESGEWVQFTKRNDDGTESSLTSNEMSSVNLPCISEGNAKNYSGIANGNGGNWLFFSDFDPTNSVQLQRLNSISPRTFVGLYTDPDCTEESRIQLNNIGAANQYNGDDYYAAYPELDPEKDHIKLYTKWEEGNCFSITTASQFSQIVKELYSKAAADSTNPDMLEDVKFYILNDLDFKKTTNAVNGVTTDPWRFSDPVSSFGNTFDLSTFEGFNIYIEGVKDDAGNLPCFKNINVSLGTDISYGGIFKALGENAVIKNIIFQDITFTVPVSTTSTVNVPSYGFLAGKIADEAIIEGVSFKNCVINIAKVEDKIKNYDIDAFTVAPFESGKVPSWIVDTSELTVKTTGKYNVSTDEYGYISLS